MKYFLCIMLSLITGMIIGVCLGYRGVFANEELASKPEWSIVQSGEWEHRGKTNRTIEFIKIEGYSLVGIPENESRKKIWIMLNAKNPPYYKQLPAGNFKLSKQDFKTILASNLVSSTVANCLESHIEEP